MAIIPCCCLVPGCEAATATPWRSLYILVVGFCSDNNYRLTNMKIFRTKYQTTDGLFDVDVEADAGAGGDGDVWSRRWRLIAYPCLLALQAGLAYFAKNKRTQSTDGHWDGETNKRRRPHSNVKHEFHVCHSIRTKYTERKLDSCRNRKTIWISYLCSKSCQKCSAFIQNQRFNPREVYF